MATLSTSNFLFWTNKKCCLNNKKKNSVRAAFCFDSFTPLWKCMCSLWKWELKSMFITSKQIYGLHYDKAKKNFFILFFFQDWDLRISWPPVSLDFTIIWLLLGQSIIFLHLLHHICHGIHATMISTQNVSFKIISYIFLSR